ncbi:SDR family NAD(P)-dependent oxidoreductase [Thermogemmatispora onikobensis]|uniref:SDR family NAD(P)-dependent oxidoreductase n=1 Tax=Thermogemmatispora onikobensis TaxID=732234 RepID=UPI0008531CF1|nr:SDR family oxidoreductase [Thermogemmatispora onikobensis]
MQSHQRGPLVGKRVLITGAAGAIGSATAAELRRQGARVIGLDRRGGEDIIQADVTSSEAVERAVAQAINELGGLDLLINLAGIGLPQDAGAPPSEDVALTLEVNLLGPWTVTAYALPALLASHGRVINVASGLAFATVPFASAYAASKRALAAWSDALRMEYGSQIGVTTVYPGYVRTPIHAASEAAGLSLADLVREEPLEAVVRTIVRCCRGRVRRDVATTRLGALEIGLARHLPALVDLVILLRLRRLARAHRYDRSPLARSMIKRWGIT